MSDTNLCIDDLLVSFCNWLRSSVENTANKTSAEFQAATGRTFRQASFALQHEFCKIWNISTRLTLTFSNNRVFEDRYSRIFRSWIFFSTRQVSRIMSDGGSAGLYSASNCKGKGASAFAR